MAPLDDPLYRRAMFDQLGEDRLESAITTDIVGKPDSFAIRLDSAVVDSVNVSSLVRNWPPALTAWSTKAVRDAFFASSQFPRLLVIDKLKDTIGRGVAGGVIAYAGKWPDGRCDPFFFEEATDPNEVEFRDDMFILTAGEAKV